MRAVVQRVKQSAVVVEGEKIARIGAGVLVLLGVGKDDTEETAEWLADKIAHLRIFEDAEGKLNRSLLDVDGEMLVVSQFTLYGDCRKGRRPSFIDAAAPEKATGLYRCFARRARTLGVAVQTGRFRAMMEVSLINHGPVTLILER